VALSRCGLAKMMWRGCFSTHPPGKKAIKPIEPSGFRRHLVLI
jgi:hypothetical protein